MISFLKSFLSFLIVVISFGVLNVFQILTLPVRIFSIKLFRKLLSHYAAACAGFCDWWMLRVYKFKPKFKMDPLPIGENAIVIANHQAFADAIVLLQFSVRLRRPGDIKMFAKNNMKWLPGPGWSLWFYDSIFLKRNWNSDAKNIEKSFAHLRKHDFPFLLTLFPEGTRLTPQKLKESKRYMISKGMVPLNSHLCPRAKGIWAATQALGDRIDAVYDLTIDYHTAKPPSFWKFISGDTPDYTLRVKRYPISDVPKDEESQRQWLIERFREKEKT